MTRRITRRIIHTAYYILLDTRYYILHSHHHHPDHDHHHHGHDHDHDDDDDHDQDDDDYVVCSM